MNRAYIETPLHAPAAPTMSAQLVPTLPSERSALAEFLHGAFLASARTNSFDSDVLEWKYSSPHPAWNGPRSYVVKKGNDIVAHAGIWPLRLANSAKELTVIHLIDWAASRSAPGAGVFLLRKLAGMSDLLLTIGGSADTQAILPKLGYRRYGDLKLQARLTRPLLQFRRSYRRDWKMPLRILRNTAWSLSPLPRVPQNWTASAVARFDDSISSILNQLPPDQAERSGLVSRRTLAGLNHLLTYPGSRFSAFLVSGSEKVRGYFVLGQFGGQARIVDLGADNDSQNCRDHDCPNQDCRAAVCMLAARTAAAMPDTGEIVAGFSCRLTQAAFARMGFRVRQVLPVFCYDPRKLLSQVSSLGLSMIDGDLCFIANSERPYLT